MPPKPTTKPVAQSAVGDLAVAAQDEPAHEASEVPPAAEVEPLAAAFTHRIAAAVEKDFYRAGRHWPREGVDVNRDSFDEAQWSALEAAPSCRSYTRPATMTTLLRYSHP